MATLVSPGVEVTVVDESAYASPGAGTIPLVVIATAQDKTDPTGTEVDGIAKYTKAAYAGRVVPVTSQRELTQFFGNPRFVSGVEGAETSEYGLLAAYSYLGQGSQVYIVRADVNLTELKERNSAPEGPANGNQIWLDTDGSKYGLHVYDASSSSWVLQSVIAEVNLAASSSEVNDPSTYVPSEPAGTAGRYLVAILNDSASTPTGFAVGYFYDDGTAWQAITPSNTANLAATNVTFSSHYQNPSSPSDQDIWVKTTRPGNGLNLAIYQSNSQGEFELLNVEGVSNDGGVTYVAQDGSSIADISASMNDNNIAIKVTASEGGFEIMRVESGVPSAVDEPVYAQDLTPTGSPLEGTYWYDGTMTDLDILIHNGTGWVRVDNANITYSVTEPLTPSNNDIWVETGVTEKDYPRIYRYDSGSSKWLQYDNTDQTTDRGVLFADFTDVDRNTVPSGGFTTSQLFENAPDYQLYPSNMLAVNMALSSGTVRVWTKNVKYADGSTTDTWLNAANNNANGSGVFGRLAQRKVIANSMQAAVAGNEDLRDPNRNFTLLCAPNFPELTDELVTLNVDRGETGFIIIDTPMRLTPTEAVNWVTGNGASENGEEGLVTKYTYSAVYYPAARSTTPDGETVTVPASHVVLYSYAYSDNISYPWFAPAGLTRGIVQNGSAVGYITTENEFKSISLSQGQRDAMYLNKLNPIAQFPLEGVVIFGQKTLHPFASALDRVNVARLVAYLRERFDEVARPLLFEQNDKLTRDRAKQLFESFLSDLLTKRALTDFAVVCDESNNTPIRIDRNELYIDVAIQPVKSVEFIYIPIRIQNTGA